MDVLERFIDMLDFIADFKLRRMLIMVVLAATTISYFRIKRTRRKITVEEEDAMIQQIYSKDENGLYPWEADKDDHPSRIQEGSKRISSKWGPRRGRW